MFPLLLLFLATLVATSQAQGDHIHLLLPQSDARKYDIPSLSCLSWHLAMETNNTVGFETVPKESLIYVEQYMSDDQDKKDSAVIIDLALRYARNLKLGGDGKDIWVFDIDETTLSNLPYYAKHGYGHVIIK
ncbi:hypothetical protein Patl1_33951 [Pistacia atlantica]|uniref:Uncharacterized protein n=1 Tax=Pistacia atlantica TaxID=434234 RepID=A0ACC0ZR90_9ROSI|nr:hypothetical protein Patl1_33951 [Pistacia atlantica]